MSAQDPRDVADARTRKRLPGGLLTVWLGQLVSAAGSSITTFVFGVWVLQQTGSTTDFAMLMLAGAVPGILTAPFAGIWADRYDRRRIMITADLIGGVATATALVLVVTDVLQTWHLYPLTVVSATAAMVHTVAFQSALPSMVGRDQLGRANGLLQITQATQIAAPVVAATLLVLFGLRGVLILDLITMTIGVTLLLVARLRPEATAPAKQGRELTIGGDLTYGWRYVMADRPLRGLVWIFTGFNFLFAMAGVLVQPLILSFSGPQTLGILMLVGGSGIFVGGLVMASWGGPVPRVRGIAIFLVIAGVALAGHSLAPSPWLIGVVAPMLLFTLPILGGSAITLVQQRTDAESMGRVMATVRMLAQAAMPLSYLCAGPLVDRVFDPAMESDGWLGSTLGQVIGTGEGRGIAAIYLILGVLTWGLAVIVMARRSLHTLETPTESADADDADAADAADATDTDATDTDAAEVDGRGSAEAAEASGTDVVTDDLARKDT